MCFTFGVIPECVDSVEIRVPSVSVCSQCSFLQWMLLTSWVEKGDTGAFNIMPLDGLEVLRAYGR